MEKENHTLIRNGVLNYPLLRFFGFKYFFIHKILVHPKKKSGKKSEKSEKIQEMFLRI